MQEFLAAADDAVAIAGVASQVAVNTEVTGREQAKDTSDVADLKGGRGEY